MFQEPEKQKNNPLHGVKLADILDELINEYGFEYLGNKVKIKCFNNNPNYKSSLNFLRKTPWARAEVEALYLKMLRQK